MRKFGHVFSKTNQLLTTVPDSSATSSQRIPKMCSIRKHKENKPDISATV